MSAFLCSECDRLRDSHDGCEPTEDGFGLICWECAQEPEDDDDDF